MPLKEATEPDCVQKGLGFSTEPQAVLAVFTGVSSAKGCGECGLSRGWSVVSVECVECGEGAGLQH